MLDAITKIIKRIENIKSNTQGYKQKQLELLLACLNSILDLKNDFYHNEIDHLLVDCNTLLADTKFTYKRISLFGLLNSRSKEVVDELIYVLRQQRPSIALEKIRLFLEGNSSTAIKEVESINDAITARNFKKANELFTQFSAHYQSDYLLMTFRYLSDYLNYRCRRAIDIPPNTKLHSRKRTPYFEINHKQPIIYLENVIDYVRRQPDEKVISFSYTIDRFGNVLFSLDANHSYHINHCHGEPCFGAGEIYMKHRGNEIEVTELNNQSGTYTPSGEFMSTMIHWLTRHGLNTQNTQQKDRRVELATHYANMRMLVK